jgi:hypothetical protein
VLAALAARFISIRGWERLGFARLQDYARERLGIAARTVQDLAHTEAALSQHPLLASALVSGRLPWSKIRLVARVVGPENVSGWVSFAEGISVRALEREVRRVDRESLERVGAAGSGGRGANRAAVETDEDGAERWLGQWVVVPCARSVQGKWYHARLLARRVAGEPVPPWQCLESVAAEVLSGFPMTAEAAQRFEQEECAERATEEDVAMGLPAEEAESRTRLPAASEATHPAANVCASEGAAFGHGPTQTRGAPEHGQGRGPSDASLGGSLPEELAPVALAIEFADPFSLDRRLRKVLAFEQRLEARLGSLLREAIEAGCPRAAGFNRFADYARDRLGVSPRRARTLLRIERSAQGAPDLMHAYREAQISPVQANALVPIVKQAPEHAATCAAHARRR